MKVSVVIPTQFRHRETLACIDSVTRQTFREFEVIFVQDGVAHSDEIKTAVLKKCKDAGIDHKVILLKHAGGAPQARNAGVAAAAGSLIAFLDDDDVWMPEKLAKQAAYLDQNPKSVAVSGDYETVEEGKVLRKFELSRKNSATRFDPLFISNSFGGCSGGMVRKSSFEAVGGFDETLPSAQDWDLWLRLSQMFGALHVIPEVLTQVTVHESEHRISNSSYRRVMGYLLFLQKHRKLIPIRLLPYHALKLVQFGAKDLPGVDRITRTMAPVFARFFEK